MANHASALKAHRQSIRRKNRNRSNRSAFRTSLKTFSEKLTAGKIEDAKASLPQLYSDIDSAVDEGVLSSNAAARHKSRLSKHLNAAASPAAK
ncbi:MAG: 30S ribosomal protein S20 [Acidobacteriia bacterium]|nr:30S ribosomal protein S20 [Terriglobia bacterium]